MKKHRKSLSRSKKLMRISMTKDIPLSPLLRLPPETLEDILSSIELHKDLLSLALVSRACSKLVIPRHIQYRILGIRGDMPSVWAHLARRSDLTKNVRVVHLFEDPLDLYLEHAPTTLVDEVLDGSPDNMVDDQRVKNICRALGYMNRLHEFTWTCDTRPTKRPFHENHIFSALNQKASLSHLVVGGRFGEYLGISSLNPAGLTYPLWNISNLHTLSIQASALVKAKVAPQMCTMFKKSPDLQVLECPMEFPQLSQCTFPRLTALRLNLQSGATPLVDCTCMQFILAHPTIEDLYWHPVGSVCLPPGALPALKRLTTWHGQIMRLLLDRTVPREIECLNGLSLSAEVARELEGTDVGSLRKLKLLNFNSLSSLKCLAALMPQLSWLHIPPFSPGAGRASVESWMDILSAFPNLEVIRGDSLWKWTMGSIDEEEVKLFVSKIARTCPKLREIDWYTFKNTAGYSELVLSVDGGKITSELKDPRCPWSASPAGTFK